MNWERPPKTRRGGRRRAESGAGPDVPPPGQAESLGAPPDPAEAEVQETLEQVPDYSYAADDPLHGKITAEIKTKVEEMFREARENPRSDANLMVRIMLLNQVARVEAERYREDPKLVLTEERRRGADHLRQLEEQRLRAGGVETRKKKVEADIKLIEVRVRDLQQQVDERDLQLSDARRAAENAKAALENGQPLEPLAVYNRIAEIVGLRAPREQEIGNT